MLSNFSFIYSILWSGIFCSFILSSIRLNFPLICFTCVSFANYSSLFVLVPVSDSTYLFRDVSPPVRDILLPENEISLLLFWAPFPEILARYFSATIPSLRNLALKELSRDLLSLLESLIFFFIELLILGYLLARILASFCSEPLFVLLRVA